MHVCVHAREVRQQKRGCESEQEREREKGEKRRKEMRKDKVQRMVVNELENDRQKPSLLALTHHVVHAMVPDN